MSEAKGCLALALIVVFLVGGVLAIGDAVFIDRGERIAAYNAQAAQAQAAAADARAREEAARQAAIQAQAQAEAARAQAEVGVAQARYEASVVWAQNGPAMMAYATIGGVVVLALVIALLALRWRSAPGPGQQERIIVLQLPPGADVTHLVAHQDHRALTRRTRQLPPRVRIIGPEDGPPSFT